MTLVVCTAIILAPALINGYPFVYSDTGTYLRSAFDGMVPYDRPYWYGPFIRAASLNGTTLWGVALLQAFLCAVYVRRITSLAVAPNKAHRIAIIAAALLTLCTGLGWYAGQLVPDVFTGIGLLAVYLLLGRSGAWACSIDVIVIAAACWMHLSNLLILPLAGILLLFLGRRATTVPLRTRIFWLTSTALLSWGGLALANLMLDGEAYISRSSHVFLLGRMIDTGMLKPYLDEHCPTEHFEICRYKDSLPQHGDDFLWRAESPLAKQGGWDATREEYEKIVHGSFTEPRFLWWHIRGSLISTGEQLCAWEISKGHASGWYRTEGSPPYGAIKDHLPHEMTSYLGSMQNGGRGDLDMHWPDNVYRSALAISLILGLWYLVRRRSGSSSREDRILIAYALGAIIIGAWICATLSMVDARYLGRDSWLLPFAVILAFTAPRASPSS